jgi:histidine ammonia-lyase
MKSPLTIDDGRYGLEELKALASAGRRLEFSSAVEERIRRCASYVAEKSGEDRYIYGVNTGFGALCERRISEDQMRALQFNHVVSHAAGVGPPVDPEIVRLMMLIKLLTFRAGTTGIGLATAQRLLDFLNADIVPVIPKKGTLGASGDLAPLSHMALPLLGLGHVLWKGQVLSGEEVLKANGWEPIELQPKEGLALTNGVQYINAIGAHCAQRAGELVQAADIMAALSLQAFSASATSYQPLYQTTSLHPERMTVANNLTALLAGSNHAELATAAKSQQDPYSFRCIPQVHAAVRQVHGFARMVIEQECNGVSDNPQFFPEQDQILFGGALHGESSAFAMDFLAIGLSELGSISERRTYQMLSGARGLPDFLVSEPGVNSGLMVVQYTAAALVNENKVFCTPASIDTIMSSQLQEDHVSMGGTSAYKLMEVLDNCEYILGIELLTAAQAIDLNDSLSLSPATRDVYQAFREEVRFVEQDRVMAEDINCARAFLRRNAGRWSAEKVAQ